VVATKGGQQCIRILGMALRLGYEVNQEGIGMSGRKKSLSDGRDSGQHSEAGDNDKQGD